MPRPAAGSAPWAREEVTADVARRHADESRETDEQVREVLADAPPLRVGRRRRSLPVSSCPDICVFFVDGVVQVEPACPARPRRFGRRSASRSRGARELRSRQLGRVRYGSSMLRCHGIHTTDLGAYVAHVEPRGSTSALRPRASNHRKLAVRRVEHDPSGRLAEHVLEVVRRPSTETLRLRFDELLQPSCIERPEQVRAALDGHHVPVRRPVDDRQLRRGLARGLPAIGACWRELTAGESPARRASSGRVSTTTAPWHTNTQFAAREAAQGAARQEIRVRAGRTKRRSLRGLPPAACQVDSTSASAEASPGRVEEAARV